MSNSSGQFKQKRIVIVGGGTAGIAVAARLRILSKSFEITIIEPSEKHFYQPLWTLVGAGVFTREQSMRMESECIPEGTNWVKQRVSKFLPTENVVITDNNRRDSYDVLVVCAGIQINWSTVKGLEEALGKGGVCSNYSFDHVHSTWDNIKGFTGGTAVFTQPATAIKCGGAPQKICYLAEDYFRNNQVRMKTKVIFASGQAGIFSVPKYAKTLEQVIERKEIDARFKLNLVEVKPAINTAVFEKIGTGEYVEVTYDMLHVTPPMGPPTFIQESPIADANGWVDVDKNTLQHIRYPNIFGVGDATNLPTSKTGAAIRKQAPVAVSNIQAFLSGVPLTSSYDGYTSCPLVTGYDKLVLAEFDYELAPKETFPFDQAQERYSMYLLKKYLLPVFYWEGMLKGLA